LPVNWDAEGKAAKILFLMIGTGMGGAMIALSEGFGSGLAQALVALGITVSAEGLAVLVLLIGLILFLCSLPQLIHALTSIKGINFSQLPS
jgi:hypothetical protein